jgi:hypothetical protein
MSWVDDLRRREDACRRAPSAHNTQPWILRYGTDAIAVHWDENRTLPAADPTRRDLFLSLGAFVENCLIVAADAGLCVAAEVAVDETAHRVARLVPAQTRYPTRFSTATVERRRCARGRYAPGRLPGRVLAAARDEAGASGANLRTLPCRALVGGLAQADRWLFGTPAVVQELRTWLRLSPRHPRYRLDGLTDRVLALSRAESLGLGAALSPLAYRLGRRIGLPAVLAAGSRGLLRCDGTIAVLVGHVTAPEDLIEHGRTLLRVWLALTELDYAVHPLSQLLDCATTGRQVRVRLGLGPHESALAIFRVGSPLAEPVRSHRLTLD